MDGLKKFTSGGMQFTPDKEELVNRANLNKGDVLWYWDAGDASSCILEDIRLTKREDQYFVGKHKLNNTGLEWAKENSKYSYTSSNYSKEQWIRLGFKPNHLTKVWLPARCFGPVGFRDTRCEMPFTEGQLIKLIRKQRKPECL